MSIPRFLAIGPNMGAIIIIAVVPSINIPIIKKSNVTISRKTVGLVA